MVTKRGKELINIYSEIPADANSVTIKQFLDKAVLDKQGLVTTVLIDTVRTLSKDTQYEDICNDIIKRCEYLMEEK